MKRLVLLVIFLFVTSAAFAQGASHSASLAWTWAQGTGDPATGFHCQRSLVTGGPYSTTVTVPSPLTLICVDSTVVGGNTYFYVVTAFNSGGDSLPTTEAKAIIPLAVPVAPAGLTITAK